MVVIRLARGGAKKRPFYNIVVADSRKPRDGRYIERIGYFNPVAKGGEVRLLIEQERVTHWTNLGAQPSDRVRSLIKQYEEEPQTEQKVTKSSKTEKSKKSAPKSGEKSASKKAKSAEQQPEEEQQAE